MNALKNAPGGFPVFDDDQPDPGCQFEQQVLRQFVDPVHYTEAEQKRKVKAQHVSGILVWILPWSVGVVLLILARVADWALNVDTMHRLVSRCALPHEPLALSWVALAFWATDCNCMCYTPVQLSLPHNTTSSTMGGVAGAGKN
jgi:hypothetical protein